MKPTRPSRFRRGQSTVETALTLPFSIILLLGMIQLFMMQQARIVAQVAAARSARAGSVYFGDCERMTHAAIGVLIPTFAHFLSPTAPRFDDSAGGRFAKAFQIHSGNKYDPAYDKISVTGAGVVPLDGPIVWLDRTLTQMRSIGTPSAPLINVSGNRDDEEFDNPAGGHVLTVDMVYWYPLRLPFVNSFIAKLALSRWSAAHAYTGFNPFMPIRPANFTATGSSPPSEIVDEFALRVFKFNQFVFPIRVNSSIRMFTPPRPMHFKSGGYIQDRCL